MYTIIGTLFIYPRKSTIFFTINFFKQYLPTYLPNFNLWKDKGNKTMSLHYIRILLIVHLNLCSVALFFCRIVPNENLLYPKYVT